MDEINIQLLEMEVKMSLPSFVFRKPRRQFPLLALAFFGLCGPLMFGQKPEAYHPFAELTNKLKALTAGPAAPARLSSIGKSGEGRDLWLLEIANPAGVPIKNRPALLIAAGFEGDHLIGSEIARSIADYLVKNYPTDPEVKRRLDESVIYILPRVNPDGAEGMFAPVKTGTRVNHTPSDSDNDGRMDEDGPEDLNKDGFITLMRVKSPGGPYIIDPTEPRLMRKADPKKGERGEYKIFWEGLDKDQDGFIGEDPAGGTDLNRNFMHDYPYYQADAGLHMVSESETRAVLDFMIEHRNIAAVLAFGESDNLIVPPNAGGRLGPAGEIDLFKFAEASNEGADKTGMVSVDEGFGGRLFRRMGGGRNQPQAAAVPRSSMPERQAAVTVNPGDVDYYRLAGEKYLELTGIRQPLFNREPHGAFFQYGYFQFGVLSFSTPGWGLAVAEAGRGRGPASVGGRAGGGASSGGETVAAMPGVDHRILQWMNTEKIDGFVPWTAFQHPQLGPVEIGGFKPYAFVNPPAAKIGELGVAHAKFALYLSSLFPRVRIASLEAVHRGGGLYRLTAEVENAGFLPLSLAHGEVSRAVRPTMLQLRVPPESIISGTPKTTSLPNLAGSGGRRKFEWLLKGKAGSALELIIVSDKGGTDKAAVVLK